MEARKKTQWELEIIENLAVAAEQWWAGNEKEAFSAIERARHEIYRVRRNIRKSLTDAGAING